MTRSITTRLVPRTRPSSRSNCASILPRSPGGPSWCRDVKVQNSSKPAVATVMFDIALFRARSPRSLEHRPHPDRMGPGETPRWPQDRSHQLDDVSRRYAVSLKLRTRKCSREESNLHGFPHTVLSRTRLPFRHVSERLLRCATSALAQAQRGACSRGGSSAPSLDAKNMAAKPRG